MKAVNLRQCKNSCGIIASIPHSSYKILPEMEKNLRSDIILANNDWFLRELYSFLDELDIVTVSANYSRYVIDVNRSIKDNINHEKYTKSLIYFKTTFNREIYTELPDKDIINYRINEIYIPYHFCLLDKINDVLKKRGRVYLLDLHSFYIQSKSDIVLGTRYGKTCSEQFLHIVYSAFVQEGFTVKVDEIGLRGGYITYHYASMENVETIQIEIRYTAYIENRFFGEEFLPKINYELFEKTQNRLKKVFTGIKKKLEYLK